MAPDATRVRIGSLAIEEEIGRGGMGIVHRARHLGLGRDVAVKFLPEAFLGNREFRARFEREARSLALLDHPNIITVHDFGTEQEQPFIVMELATGGSLAEKVPLDPSRTREIALDVCSALEYAHARGVVHRDIKPQNVLFDAENRVKIGDFGLARVIRGEAVGWSITATHQAVGTPHFMAPEALAGAPADPRMDVYSLGVLLYQMLTGKLPAGSYEPPPEPYAAIVSRALAQEPSKRYPSVEELRRDLESVAFDQPFVVGAHLSEEERTWRGGVALLLTIATAVGLWAAVECLTPKTLGAEDKRSLILHVTRWNADGSFDSAARFETWPVLSALAAMACGVFAYSLLWRHWKQEGRTVSLRQQPIREVRWVLVAGMAAFAVYALKGWLATHGQAWANVYAPPVGGVIEIVWLYFFWVCVLESWRTARPLRREPCLWVGSILALTPPSRDFLRYVLLETA